MKKKQSSVKDILFISISSFIVVAAWIGFNIYHSWVTTTITPELQIQITPINPTFDTATIQELKSRQQVEPISQLSGKIAEPTPATQLQPAQQTTPAVQQPTPTEQIEPEEQIPVTVEGE